MGHCRMAAFFSCCWRFKFSPEEIEQRNKSKMIDKAINKERKVREKQIRLLLLGAGESGKSTFLKQMRIIHGLGFDDDSIRGFRRIIYLNVVQGMKVLVDARKKSGLEWENPQNELHGNILLSFQPLGMLDYYTFSRYVTSVKACWNDDVIRKLFARRSLFQISDSVGYFFNNLDRISSMEWIPSNADMLQARRATKGIYELSIPIHGIPFHFIDVGGQRSQREKWLQCFDCITSILFLVASSEFDQVLLEDRRTNRIEEARTIFDAIINNSTFVNVSVILFLNKTDLLVAKISSGIRIANYFPQYKGDNSVESVQKFILHLFTSLKRSSQTQLFHHYTTAIDTENIRVVFDAVKNTILKKNLEKIMLQ